jgi:hypothetical protein
VVVCTNYASIVYVQTMTDIFKRRVHIVYVLAITDAVSCFDSNDELIPRNNTCPLLICIVLTTLFPSSTTNNESIPKEKQMRYHPLGVCVWDWISLPNNSGRNWTNLIRNTKLPARAMITEGGDWSFGFIVSPCSALTWSSILLNPVKEIHLIFLLLLLYYYYY